MTQLRDDRYWIDGCFDFTHHGHAGAIQQARALGDELYVGVHTDEEIYRNKGPTVMTLEERVMAVEACKWTTKSVPGAPYVTDPAVMDEYGCRFVVHGDDITTDADGNDAYRIVKEAGRFVVVKRTPNISTTDLVGRMLDGSTAHHLPVLTAANCAEHPLLTADSLERIRRYATGADARSPYDGVYVVEDSGAGAVRELVAPSSENGEALRQRAYYVDGGFDLFFNGHIEFLRQVRAKADAEGARVVVGLHDDATVNAVKGSNYPIMNLYERALVTLQARYLDAIVLGAPFEPTETFLAKLRDAGAANVVKVLHGPTPVVGERGTRDVEPYSYVKAAGMYDEVGPHRFDSVSSTTIVERVLRYREQYEERQRKKGWKAENEKRLQEAERATSA